MSEAAEARPVTTQASEPVTNMNAEAPRAAEPQDNDKIAHAFSRAAKQDTHLRNERQKLAEAAKAQEADIKEAQEWRSIKALRDKDPIEALKALGYDTQKLAQHLGATQSGNATVDALLAKVQALEAKTAQAESKAEQSERDRGEKYLNNQIAQAIKHEDYNVIEHFGAQAAVRQFMETVYDKTGEIPSVKDACEAVSADIIAKTAKVANHKRVQEKVAPKKEGLRPEDFNITPKPKVTLMNKLTQSESKSAAPNTDAERVAAAIALVNKMSQKK